MPPLMGLRIGRPAPHMPEALEDTREMPRPSDAGAPRAYRRTARRRRALVITLTLDSAMAAAATAGERSQPKNG